MFDEREGSGRFGPLARGRFHRRIAAAALLTLAAVTGGTAWARGIGGQGGGSPCPADLDGDGAVGFSDLLVLLGQWGPCPGCSGDLDGDGTVAFADLLQLLGGWGPCLFDYGPPRENAEAEQIGLEMLGAGGPLLLPDAIYERVDRDLGLIRAAEPDLVGETHSLAWSPNQLIVQKVPAAPQEEYEALNAYFQVVLEDPLFGDWYVLTFPGNVNVPRMAAEYTALDAVAYSEPNYWIGGANFWSPVMLVGGTWRWNIDDGFTDCFDGCDCHIYYVFDVQEGGTVVQVSCQQVGQSWCVFTVGCD